MTRSVVKVFPASGMIIFLGAAFLLTACERERPATLGGPPVVRQLTPDQYAQSIEDIFGADIKFARGPDPITRESGLLAVGLGRSSIPPRSLEFYAANARDIAAQVVDEKHRVSTIGCPESKPRKADDACLEQFIADVGLLLYRRPLRPVELQAQRALVDDAAVKLGDGYAGVEASLASMLAGPQFLFRWETTEPDPKRQDKLRLDAFSKASRLSFLLWNSTPDGELLEAAESGSLHTKNGWQQQVDRLLSSPRLEGGVRAFFTDMLGFDGFSGLSKDQTLFPNYSTVVAVDAKEQTLRTIVDVLLTDEGDYRDLFTTRKTFLTRNLGAIYNIPVMTPKGWESHEFAENDPRAAGILTHLSFAGLHSHPGRSSPTLRGKALREVLLCQKVPDPPGDVDFSEFEASTSMVPTARERLVAHASAPACTGCHKVTDPIGLAMEKLDSVGNFRERENGALIDGSGELDGVAVDGATGLGRALKGNPAASTCLINRMYAYAVGRQPTARETAWLRNDVQETFAEEEYRLIPLLRRLVLSAAFTAIALPKAE